MRIGCGAGFSSDRLDGAVRLAERGKLDALVFECVGERTLAFGHRDRLKDSETGFNPYLADRFRAVLPHTLASATRIVTNMGVANVRGAVAETCKVVDQLGLQCRIAAVLGDDVTELMGPDTPLPAMGGTIADVPGRLLGANAYIGADGVQRALDQGADVVIGGRLADPSMFLGLLRHHFSWPETDWRLMGAGTMVGHLLECGTQITGGYFADPPHKMVPDLANVGYPIAEVDTDGNAVITKLPRDGGMVTPATVKEQLFYEVHDPTRYLTPDVTADFSGISINEDGPDRVRVTGAGGAARPEKLKVTVAFDGGWLAEGEVSYAGPGALDRAKLAAEIAEKRLRHVHHVAGDLRADLIGVSSLHAHTAGPAVTEDVRVRIAGRFAEAEDGRKLLWEMESLLCAGPAGGGGFRGRNAQSVVTHDAWLDRSDVPVHVEMTEV